MDGNSNGIGDDNCDNHCNGYYGGGDSGSSGNGSDVGFSGRCTRDDRGDRKSRVRNQPRLQTSERVATSHVIDLHATINMAVGWEHALG